MARLLIQQVEQADGSVCVHSKVTSRASFGKHRTGGQDLLLATFLQ